MSAASALLCEKKTLHRARKSELPRAKIQYLKMTASQVSFLRDTDHLPVLNSFSQSQAQWSTLNTRLKAARKRTAHKRVDCSYAGLVVSVPGSRTQSPAKPPGSKGNFPSVPVYLKGVFRSIWTSNHLRRSTPLRHPSPFPPAHL